MAVCGFNSQSGRTNWFLFFLASTKRRNFEFFHSTRNDVLKAKNGEWRMRFEECTDTKLILLSLLSVGYNMNGLYSLRYFPNSLIFLTSPLIYLNIIITHLCASVNSLIHIFYLIWPFRYISWKRNLYIKHWMND